jgi:hypothetical protein
VATQPADDGVVGDIRNRHVQVVAEPTFSVAIDDNPIDVCDQERL